MRERETDRDANSEDTHDGDVVERHSNVLAVVQGRDLDVASLPGQESSKQLEDMLLYSSIVYLSLQCWKL